MYQSKDMQRLYQQFGKHLVLVYVTYKTTKYSFKLHFLVNQTNVNCQVAAAIVTQEETTCMSLKTLPIIKGNFNTLDIIFSFPFPVFYQYFLFILWFSYDFRAHISRRVKKTLKRNGVKGADFCVCRLESKNCC